MDLMRGGDVPYVLVLTKTDKLSGNGRARRRAALSQVEVKNNTFVREIRTISA